MFEQVFEQQLRRGDLDPVPPKLQRLFSGVGPGSMVRWVRGAAVRRYDDSVEVRKGMVGTIEAPEQFLWHGRLWKVRDVIAHWVETGPWWQSAGVRAVIGSNEVPEAGSEPVAVDLLAEREMWRVEAAAGMTTGGGVFDLSFSWSDGSWQLVGCVD